MTVFTVGALKVQARGFGDGLLNTIITRLKMVSGDDLFPRLALIDAIADERIANPISFGKIDSGVRHSVRINNVMGARRVEKLFAASRPAAVLGAVALGVIETLKGVNRRGFVAHVGEELGETVLAAPLIANRNTASTVTRIASVPSRFAASPHKIVRSLEGMNSHGA